MEIANCCGHGNRFGKTCLIEIGGNSCPLFLVVAADSPTNNDLADNKYGSNIIVDNALRPFGVTPIKKSKRRPQYVET